MPNVSIVSTLSPEKTLYFQIEKHNLINHHVLLFGSERLYTIYYSYSCFCCCSGDVVVVVTVVVLPCQLVLLWEYCVSCWLSPVQCITTNLMRLFHAKFAIHAFNPNELAKSLSLSHSLYIIFAANTISIVHGNNYKVFACFQAISIISGEYHKP